MAARARLKNKFTEDKKYRNLMRRLVCTAIIHKDPQYVNFAVLFEIFQLAGLWVTGGAKSWKLL